MEKKKLGVLLSTAPSHPNLTTVSHLCRGALTAGADVYLYLIDEGVKNLRDPAIATLVNRGAHVFVCAYGCQQHHVATDDIDKRISLCGLVVLGNMITGCRPFLAFN